MLSCSFLSSATLLPSPFITINDLKLSAYKKFPFRRTSKSSISCTATIFPTKFDDVSMDTAAKTQEPTFEFLSRKAYAPPSWAAHLNPLPSEIYSLGHVCVFKGAFDDIVVACGSGAALAGLSLGSSLSNLGAKVHAYCVCDDPEYFYDYAQVLLDGLQAGAKGLGYAINTMEELSFIREVAETIGVVLDPVYSGKAAYGMMKDMADNPGKWEGRKVLFIHTGGLLGLFDKTEQMAPLIEKWRRMYIHESVARKEGIGKMF